MRTMQISIVPCNGCTLCCRGDAVRLLPADDPNQYITEPHSIIKGALMLAHKPNGECIYLGEGGCTIHDTSPQQCKEMDCRRIAAKITFTQARKMTKTGYFNMRVWQKGRDLANVKKKK